ncbi:MAG: 3-deoxy-D-manno-octulosonic acid transferase [Rubellimicrobium sp.]|nr:3-deoxy-D-manno-octulosonic acid transferase [Rubellimicrobium sp.]
MGRSLSLTAWLALRRGASEEDPPPPLRPALAAGEILVWVHCPDPTGIQAVPALSEALAAEGQAARLVLTVPGLASEQPRLPGAVPLDLPPEYRTPVRAFLTALRPDVLIWMGAPLRPMLLTEARGLPFLRLLVDAREETLALDGGGWIPGALGALVSGFDHTLAVDHVTAQRIERLGLDEARIEVTGAFRPLARPPACNERERRDLAQVIGSRPVWLAAEVPMAELHDVIAAHRHAARAMHRLLLILAPARSEDMAPMAATLRDAGLNVALRWDGDDPGDATDVYLAEGPGELGLWYRLAPVTYLGGTLTSGASHHPFEAAALGTAIIHGGRTTPHAGPFARLTRAGAARTIRGGQNLGHAVEALLAADRAAAMAAAAWEVATEGAVVANRIVELIRARQAGAG